VEAKRIDLEAKKKKAEQMAAIKAGVPGAYSQDKEKFSEDI